LGTDAPPKDLEEFFSYCEKIQEYQRSWNARVATYNSTHDLKKSNLSLVPIASAKYQTHLFKSRYNTILTFDHYLDLDEDCDGKVMDSELFAGILGGERIVNDEKYKVANELLKRMANYFPRGFMSLGRMDSGFAFVQSRAGMITSGSWDASSYLKQAKEQPSGDLIVSVDGEKVANASDAKAKLLSKVGSGNVVVVVSRDGIESSFTLQPIRDGATLFSTYGIEIEDIADIENGVTSPFVTIVDSESPASRAGLKPRKSFEVGVFDFPLPLKTDPVYGEYVVGKVAELARTGGAFGICKFSKNQDLAIKFLQFCTTPENNELFNKICQWMPVVKGAEIPKDLVPFKPHPEGYYAALSFHKLQRSATLEQQAFWPYISDPSVKYEWFKKKILKSLPEALARDYVTIVRNVKEQVPDKMARRSAFLSDSIFSDDATSKRKNEKLAAAWDVLWYSRTEMNRFNAQIKPFESKKKKDKFNQVFFEFLNRE
jgi:ABC-type glycerol-3-phosphate transport system substrate-binding protein